MHDTPQFLLAWTNNLMAITGYEFDYLTPDEMEVV